MFLTRGDLWLSWEHGLKFFLNYMIDSDWAVCAGNWMWVSSSAFEKSLNNKELSLDPTLLGYRMDPDGHYIKKFIPQLSRMPVEYVNEPWRAPESVQREVGCVIGMDYPAPIVNHREVSRRNKDMMEELQGKLRRKSERLLLPKIIRYDEDALETVIGLRDI